MILSGYAWIFPYEPSLSHLSPIYSLAIAPLPCLSQYVPFTKASGSNWSQHPGGCCSISRKGIQLHLRCCSCLLCTSFYPLCASS